jgi:MFS family permease
MEQAEPLASSFRAFHAFRSREFRLVWSAQVVSLAGDAAFVTALGWRTFTLAGSGKLGIVLVCQALAMLTTVLIGGALADRFPRRTLMIASDLARLAAVGALAGFDASGRLGFPVLLLLATLMGLGDGFFYPAFGGIVPLLVEPYAVPSANAMIGLARWSSVLIGPSLAAFAYGGAGSATVFALDAGSFLFSAALLRACSACSRRAPSSRCGRTPPSRSSRSWRTVGTSGRPLVNWHRRSRSTRPEKPAPRPPRAAT